MTFLTDYYLAAVSLLTGLCLVYVVMDLRYVWGVRDAAYRNMLPFMWIIAAGVAALHVLWFAPLQVAEGEPLEVGLDLFFAALFAWNAHRWYRIWKDADDDTWKRRRRRLAERLALVGDRLVPLPVTS